MAEVTTPAPRSSSVRTAGRAASRGRRAADDCRAAWRQPADFGGGGQPRAGRRPHGAAPAAARRSGRAPPDDLHRVGRSRSSGRWPRRRTACACWSKASRARGRSSSRTIAASSGAAEAAARNGRAIDRYRRTRPAAPGARRPRAVARHRIVARHQDAGHEPGRSAADCVPPGQPARHEGRGQAAAARGEQPVDEARRGLDGAVARNRGARAEGPDRVDARKRK